MQAEIWKNDFLADGQIHEHPACSSKPYTTVSGVRIPSLRHFDSIEFLSNCWVSGNAHWQQIHPCLVLFAGVIH
jgi:hypothetical protein